MIRYIYIDLLCTPRLAVWTLKSRRTLQLRQTPKRNLIGSEWLSKSLCRLLKYFTHIRDSLHVKTNLFLSDLFSSLPPCLPPFFTLLISPSVFCRDTARMTVRKIQFAPDETGAPGPRADICKSFMMSDKPVHLQASLEKEVSYTEGLAGFYSASTVATLLENIMKRGCRH